MKRQSPRRTRIRPPFAPLSRAVFATLASCLLAAQPAKSAEPSITEVSARILQAATNSDVAYSRLCHLCDTFGPRFSGTTNLEAAIDWVLDEARKDGLDNVHGEEVAVPRWVRGRESLAMIEPRRLALAMTGLGGSVATPPQGIEAPVLVVKSFAELHARAAEAKGKIVVFNAPFTSYGETVQYRYLGANEAAKAGAVASLVRSITPYSLQTPHTGAMHYYEGAPRIPHAAITVEDAELLQRLQSEERRVVLHLAMEAQTLPDTLSRNVIAEIAGREKPGEFVVVSGHIDSWDITPGALDDGGGVLAAWEAVRLIKSLGLHPRRTIRLVLWTNEENGSAGAVDYKKRHLEELPGHVLAMESDMVVLQPTGFVCALSEEGMRQAGSMAPALRELGAATFHPGGAGADLGPIHEQGVPCMELQTRNDLYFRYHHTAADTPDKVNPLELNLCAGAMAVMAYAAAESPDKLKR